MEYTVPTYPAIQFFMKWGAGIGVVLALAIVAGGAWAISACGLSWFLMLPAAGAAALVWLIFMVVTELLRVVADTLMPR